MTDAQCPRSEDSIAIAGEPTRLIDLAPEGPDTEQTHGSSPLAKMVRQVQLPPSHLPRRHFKSAKRWWSALSLPLRIASVAVVLMLAIRIATPYAVKWYINDYLDSHPDYDGYVKDVDVSFLDGTITAKDLVIYEKGADKPMLEIEASTLDYNWKPLLNGELYGHAVALRPTLRVTASATADDSGSPEEDDDTESGFALEALMSKLVPTDLDQVSIIDGKVIVNQDFGQTVTVHNLYLRADNFTNMQVPAPQMPTHVELRGRMLGGRIFGNADLNLGEKDPYFNVTMYIRSIDLTKANRIADQYIGMDFEGGTFDGALKLRARGDEADGYMNVSLRNADLWSLDSDDGGMLGETKSALADAGKAILEDSSNDLGARVPISGSLLSPNAGSRWDVLGSMLKHGFIDSIEPTVSGS